MCPVRLVSLWINAENRRRECRPERNERMNEKVSVCCAKDHAANGEKKTARKKYRQTIISIPKRNPIIQQSKTASKEKSKEYKNENILRMNIYNKSNI